MSTKPARTKIDTICSGNLTEADLRRFADFDNNDRFVGLKPGVRSSDINPNWRDDALAWAHVMSAIMLSRLVKRDRARRLAEAFTLQVVAGVFSKPHYESTENGETLYFGEFWYLTEEERAEHSLHYWESLDTPGCFDTPEAVRGIDHGLAIIEAFAEGFRSEEDPEKVRFIRKSAVEIISTWDSLFEDRMLQDALKVAISSDNFSRKGRLTRDLATEAAALYSERHKRIQAASKDYTAHKRSAAWQKHVALEDKKRAGRPKIPASKIAQLPDKSPREIALEWTAEDLNRSHSDLAATANTVRRLLEAAHKADIQTINGDNTG